ncbi:MAG: response regulator [Nitrospirae bacterium]|nr:response regulator [Nitrospirota bacterium]
MPKVIFSREQVHEVVLKDKKVIVIDDFKEFRDSLRRTLIGLGAKVVDTCEDGNDAINKISHKTYDIILCDYNLGEGKKDGQQVFEELLYNKKIGHATIYIMITAENTVNMVMSMMEFQPDAYLIKPFNYKDLITRIKDIGEKKQLFAETDKAITQRNYPTALTLCDELLANHPKYLVAILKIKSDIYMRMSNYEEAEKVFLQITNKYRVPWAVFGLGKVYFFTRRFIDARDTFKSLIEDNDQFIPAYDWLAKSLEELNDKRGAQLILEEAINMSPKAILRQRALGGVAFKNKDFNKAEASFKNAIKLGKTSSFKDSSDYTQLAKALVKKNNTAKAFEIVNEVRADFAENDEVLLQASIIESDIYSEINQPEKAVEALQKAETIYNKLDGNVPAGTAIDIAQAYIKFGQKDKGMELMKFIVKNNHSNDGILDRVQSTFKDLGMGEEGLAFVANTKTEIIKLNNQGVELINKGMHTEAIELFEKAADSMPANLVINLNALMSLTGYMQKKGRDDRYLYKCEKLIKRIDAIDPDNMKFLQLMDVYTTLMSKQKTEA